MRMLVLLAGLLLLTGCQERQEGAGNTTPVAPQLQWVTVSNETCGNSSKNDGVTPISVVVVQVLPDSDCNVTISAPADGGGTPFNGTVAPGTTWVFPSTANGSVRFSCGNSTKSRCNYRYRIVHKDNQAPEKTVKVLDEDVSEVCGGAGTSLDFGAGGAWLSIVPGPGCPVQFSQGGGAPQLVDKPANPANATFTKVSGVVSINCTTAAGQEKCSYKYTVEAK